MVIRYQFCFRMNVAFSIIVIALIVKDLGAVDDTKVIDQTNKKIEKCTEFSKFVDVCDQALIDYAAKHTEIKNLSQDVSNFMKVRDEALKSPSEKLDTDTTVAYNIMLTNFNAYSLNMSEDELAARAQEMVTLQNSYKGAHGCKAITVSQIKC